MPTPVTKAAVTWFALLAAIVIPAVAPARQVEQWPYDRLFKEATVVVIATAQATVGTEDRAKDDRWAPSLVGQNTTFTVQAVLQGRPADGPVTVRHFKLKDGVAAQNGPLLVAFRTTGPTIEGAGAVKYKANLGTPQYLLFLKPTGDGRYEPVSGEVDPALSVKEIYAPLPTVIDGW